MVYGQDEAVYAVSEAARRMRADLQTDNRPTSFLFVGPTGVGKTELAKALAESLFDDEDALIRIDMGEYQDQSSVAGLIGSRPRARRFRGRRLPHRTGAPQPLLDRPV